MSDGVVHNINFVNQHDEIKIFGIDHPKATVKGINHNTKTIVIHFKGQTINPGSRNSMLRHYYPAHTIVYTWEIADDSFPTGTVFLKKLLEY